MNPVLQITVLFLPFAHELWMYVCAWKNPKKVIRHHPHCYYYYRTVLGKIGARE